MDWKTIGIIFRKEFLDILRDRKTLIFMIALPVLVMPGLMSVMTRLALRGQEEARRTPLVVQCEDEERVRFLEALRSATHRFDSAIDRMILGLDPKLAAKIVAIAKDVGMAPRDVLIGLNADPRVRAHPRTAEVRGDLTAEMSRMQKELSGKEGKAAAKRLGMDDPDDPIARDLQKLPDLITTISAIDYRSAAEVAALPAGPRAAAPDSDLPDSVKGDAARRAAADAITSHRIHARIKVPAALDKTLPDRDETAAIEVEWDSTWPLSDEANRRLASAIETTGNGVREARLKKAELPTSFITPLRVDAQNVAPREKEAMNFVGGFLPYILILMCFLGGNFPAVDLGAGEKERLTLETLLVTPSRRSEIATAKFLVIFLCALTASVCATASMAYTFQSGLMSPQLAAGLKLDVRPLTVALVLSLVVPLAAIFASILLSLSIYAKSFKEAQSYMAPVQFLIIIPAAISMIPTFQLDKRTAWIPVVNVTLGLREVLTLGGKTPPWSELAIIVCSTVVLAVLALRFCARRFAREDVLFRS